MKKIAVMVGSQRAGSINQLFAQALEKLGADRLSFDYLDIGALPFYNEDLWANPPEDVTKIREQIIAADGVLIVMPEFNRSFPAVIKNALDWASRPYGQSAWMDKPVATVGTSPGAIGSSAGQSHLRTILPVYGMVVMGQPEVYLQWTDGLVDANNDVTNEATRAFLAGFVDRFGDWVERHGPVQQAAE